MFQGGRPTFDSVCRCSIVDQAAENAPDPGARTVTRETATRQVLAAVDWSQRNTVSPLGRVVPGGARAENRRVACYPVRR